MIKRVLTAVALLVALSVPALAQRECTSVGLLPVLTFYGTDSTLHELGCFNGTNALALPMGAGAASGSVASTNASVPTATLFTVPANVSAAGNLYQVDLYGYDSAAGTGCTGNTTVVWTISYTDPTGTAQTQTATETVTTNGGATGGDKLQSTFVLAAKFQTTVSYSTTYTIGTGCTLGPKTSALLKIYG